MNHAPEDNSDRWLEQPYDQPAGKLDDSDRLRERLFLVPNDIDAMRRLAALREAAGDLPDAIDLYQRALRVDPYRLDILLPLGRLWSELGDRDRADSWIKRAFAVDPDNAEAAALSAALDREPKLTATYIKTLFDQYADRFDAELTGTLDYRAPECVATLLGRHRACSHGLDILDLGCGTGLSGVALHPFAARLDGVDLSPGMIAKARLRGLYASLDIAEALDYLSVSSKSWEVIAAVDMLNYIGDLFPLFTASAARLQPAGLLIGTVEKGADDGVVLTAKKRHTHGHDHVVNALEKVGLQLLEIMDADLRQEDGVPVIGQVFIAGVKRC